MSQSLPREPSPELLNLAHPTCEEVIAGVIKNRQHISQIINGKSNDFLDISGGCGSSVEEMSEIILEASESFSPPEHENVFRVYRSCVFKPRSNPNDWHGMETTEPEEAFILQQKLASLGVATAMEIANTDHILSYSKLLSFAWTGSRNAQKLDLITGLALKDIQLPIGVKSNMDGSVTRGIETVATINTLRQKRAKLLGVLAAPAVLIFRGGENLKTPEEWEQQYIRAHELTEGKIIVDTAHGTEMAHHPEGAFEKSVEGQTIAQKHLVKIAQEGYMPVGKLSEASSTVGKTDPNMPLEPSLMFGIELATIKSRM